MEKKIVCFAQREKFLPEQADVFSVVEFRSMGLSHVLLYYVLQKLAYGTRIWKT